MIRLLLQAGAVLVLVGAPAAAIAYGWRWVRGRPIENRRRRTALQRATWTASSQVLEDRTVVVVRKALPAAGGGDETIGQMTVAEVAADDPEWDVKVSQALMDARVRADILNQEDHPLGPR